MSPHFALYIVVIVLLKFGDLRYPTSWTVRGSPSSLLPNTGVHLPVGPGQGRNTNEYQVVYEDGGLELTIHINHAKPAKFTAPDLPEPLPPAETPCPLLSYHPAGLARRPPKPCAPPADHSVAHALPAVPAEHNMPPPATAPANQRSEPAPPHRRSPRLNPEQGEAHAILSPPAVRPPHSANRFKMACTYPITIEYNDCLGKKANPLSFSSLRLVDLRNGHSQYLSTMGQLMDALPKTLDPAFRFTLRGHVAHPGQDRLRHSMRAAIWFLLPSDGVFRHSSSSLQYYLTRQGRHVVLQGGDVT